MTTQTPTAPTPEVSAPKAVVHPLIDILEGPEAFILVADLPGVAPDTLDVQVEAGVLSLRASTDSLEYRRSFTLDRDIEVGGIEAKLEHGELRLHMPKRAEARVRKISVGG